jgi:hypothetical protein
MKIRHLLPLSIILSQAACLPQTNPILTTAQHPIPATSTNQPILQIDPGGHLATISNEKHAIQKKRLNQDFQDFRIFRIKKLMVQGSQYNKIIQNKNISSYYNNVFK